jgi:chromosome partitioning protein
LREVEGLELAPGLIVRRKAFPNAAAAGLSVLEHDDPKAIDELTRLTDMLFVHANAIGAK